MLTFVKIQCEVAGVASIGMPFPVEAFRAKIPGGWLVGRPDSGGTGTTFVPDPEHKWDGSSLP